MLSARYLEENAAAVSVQLSPGDLQVPDQAGQAVGQRYADMAEEARPRTSSAPVADNPPMWRSRHAHKPHQWRGSSRTADFRSRSARSARTIKAREIGDLDRDSAALAQIAKSPFSKIVSTSIAAPIRQPGWNQDLARSSSVSRPPQRHRIPTLAPRGSQPPVADSLVHPARLPAAAPRQPKQSSGGLWKPIHPPNSTLYW